jgi:hypothetical protein
VAYCFLQQQHIIGMMWQSVLGHGIVKNTSIHAAEQSGGTIFLIVCGFTVSTGLSIFEILF